MAPRPRRGRSAGVPRSQPTVEPVEATGGSGAPSGEELRSDTGPSAVPTSAPPVAGTTAEPATAAELRELTRSVQALVAGMAQRESASPGPETTAVPERRVPAEGHTAHALRDFLRLDTPSLRGEPDPEVA